MYNQKRLLGVQTFLGGFARISDSKRKLSSRSGRIEETFREDTYLISQMGLAAVQGLQGGNKGVEQRHVISSPKHFAGYAQVSVGR